MCIVTLRGKWTFSDEPVRKVKNSEQDNELQHCVCAIVPVTFISFDLYQLISWSYLLFFIWIFHFFSPSYSFGSKRLTVFGACSFRSEQGWWLPFFRIPKNILLTRYIMNCFLFHLFEYLTIKTFWQIIKWFYKENWFNQENLTHNSCGKIWKW